MGCGLHHIECSGMKSRRTGPIYEWFRERDFVKKFDGILDNIPDFEQLDQCFIHSDIGPQYTTLGKNDKVIFVDLDDAGVGSRFLNLGRPFIMQFADVNFDLAEK